ncbi:pilus assembly FimT family protein [Desulfovirgula thermocuniculi]|uniref:pilus assembly FimT family protein n=1 Tax=Desulfovirgula thermocuniculi TaxID=348842 RepID=UPI00040A709E|nr:prepilin-type N-terminal cleavage/methylation domain-containing protein [Desulfovirgula thermocuniculi]
MPRRKNAFTLVELLAVVAISGTLLLVALPAVLGALVNRSLYGAAHQMAADIRTWQQRALASMDENGIYLILFDTSNEVYHLMYNYKVTETRRLPVYLDLEATNFPPSGYELRFDLKGVPNAGGTVTLRERLTGRRYYVIVAPVTGRVRVSPSPPSGGDY